MSETRTINGQLYEFDESGVSNCCTSHFSWDTHDGMGICNNCGEHAMETYECPICGGLYDAEYDDLEDHIKKDIRRLSEVAIKWFISEGRWHFSAMEDGSQVDIDTGFSSDLGLAHVKAQIAEY